VPEPEPREDGPLFLGGMTHLSIVSLRLLVWLLGRGPGCGGAWLLPPMGVCPSLRGKRVCSVHAAPWDAISAPTTRLSSKGGMTTGVGWARGSSEEDHSRFVICAWTHVQTQVPMTATWRGANKRAQGAGATRLAVTTSIFTARPLSPVLGHLKREKDAS
jgi:hypothetical protein